MRLTHYPRLYGGLGTFSLIGIAVISVVALVVHMGVNGSRSAVPQTRNWMSASRAEAPAPTSPTPGSSRPPQGSRPSAMVWIRSHLSSKDIVLEAVGRDYTEAAVASSASRVPTLLGWRGHELTWRGNIAGLVTRFLGAAYIYGEGATADAAARARELGVTYVYIGLEEIAQYGASIASKFAAWDTVYAANGSRVVRVPVEAAR